MLQSAGSGIRIAGSGDRKWWKRHWNMLEIFFFAEIYFFYVIKNEYLKSLNVSRIRCKWYWKMINGMENDTGNGK